LQIPGRYEFLKCQPGLWQHESMYLSQSLTPARLAQVPAPWLHSHPVTAVAPICSSTRVTCVR
jgi:hypothetical protein